MSNKMVTSLSSRYIVVALLVPVLPLAGLTPRYLWSCSQISKLRLVSIQGGVPHIAVPGQSCKDVEGQVCAGRRAAILAVLQPGQELASCASQCTDSGHPAYASAKSYKNSDRAGQVEVAGPSMQKLHIHESSSTPHLA